MTVTESNEICIEIISDGFIIYLNRFLETIETNTDQLVYNTPPICSRSGELSTRSGDKMRVRSVAYADGNLKLFVGTQLLNYVSMDQITNQIEFSNLGQIHGQSAMFIAYANKILMLKTEDLIQTTLKTFTHKIISFILRMPHVYSFRFRPKFGGEAGLLAIFNLHQDIFTSLGITPVKSFFRI